MSVSKHTALSRQVTAYIPATVVRWYTSASKDQRHTFSTHPGSLVCVDASGFTALTKRLTELDHEGRRGPEHLTRILNCFFENMAEVAFAHGGDILKFAGDALWVFFENDFDPESYLSDTLSALEKVNAADTYTQEQPLTVHIGAEYGTLALLSLGKPDYRLEAEPFGKMVATVYQACDLAGTNRIATGPELARKIGVAELNIDGFAVLDAKSGNHKVTAVRKTSFESLPETDVLQKYLPEEILDKLQVADQSTVEQSEHRKVTVLFARFDPRFSDEDIETRYAELNSRIARAFELIDSYKGTVARIDPFKSGHKLLVFFGAPVKHEDDELRAAACARKLMDLTDGEIGIGVGLAFGSLFCGDVGATQRREYTVMGDGVNMAARLMAKAASGETLVDAHLRTRLPQTVTTQPVTLSLKGVGDSVRCHRLSGIAENSEVNSRTVAAEDIIGQEAQLARLQECWRKSRTNHGSAVNVTGAAGVGKTTLVSRFVSELADDAVVFITCRDVILYGTGWPARRIPQQLYAEYHQGSREDLTAIAKRVVGERWLPLLHDIIEIDIPANEWTRDLTPELRSEKTREVYRSLIRELVTVPVAVVVDDFHRADQFSRELIQSVSEITAETPLVLLMVSREVEPIDSANDDTVQRLKVEPPSEQAWQQHFTATFEDGTRERELINKILVRSQGNPQWITRYLAHCIEQNWLRRNPASQRWEIADTTVEMLAPEQIGDLYLAAFDSLPETEREWLKVASVAGSEFTPDDISSVQNSSIPQGVLERLAKRGILEQRSETPSYDFAQTAMREAVYGCLPVTVRRTYHARYGEKYAARFGDKRPELLAYHFFHSESWKQAFAQSFSAARQALSRNAVIEAAGFFGQCQEIASRHADGIPSELQVTFHREFVDFLHLEGRLSEAYPACRRWRRLAKHTDEVEACLEAPLEAARTLWKQSRYPRARRIVSRLAESSALPDNPRLHAGVYALMGEIERRMAAFDTAEEWYRKAIAIAEEHHDAVKMAESYNNLGLALWGSGRLEAAAEAFGKSLKHTDDSCGMSDKAETINNLAIIHYALGQYVRSEQLLFEALGIFRDVGNRMAEAYASGNLANISRILGKLKQCRQLLERADAIFLRTDDRHAHHYTVGNLGDLDLVYGDWDSAEQRFTQAAAFAEEVGDKELAAECKVRFGDLDFFRHQPEVAQTHYDQAVATAEEIGSLEFLLRATIGLARLAIEQRNIIVAEQHIETIRKRAAEEQVIIAENEAAFLVGEQKRISGDPEGASQQFRQVLDYSRTNGMFELALKAAVRWFEIAPDSHSPAETAVQELISQFSADNGTPEGLELLLTSGYFAYFAPTIRKISDLSKAQKVLPRPR